MMHILYAITVIALISILSVNGFVELDLIDGYFEEKFIGHANIVGCFKKHEQYATLKSLATKKHFVSVINIHEMDKLEILKTRHYHIGVVLDGDCEDSNAFLIQNGEKNHFNVQHHWLILTSTQNFSYLFDKVTTFINSDISVAYPSEGNTGEKHYIIEEVYNPAQGKGGHLKRRVLGSFNVSYGYNAREKRCKYWVRRNMTGVRLKTTIVLPVAFEGSLTNYLQSDKDRQINTFNRFHYNLMCHCENYYNFTRSVGMHKSWGYLQKDGSFDGLVGQLQRKQIDYGSSPLFVRADRGTVIEYGRKTWSLRSAFIFRRPKIKGSADVFLKPLSTSVWILTLVAAGLMIIALKLSNMCEKRCEQLGKSTENSWSLFVINAVAAFCQQGLTAVPYFVAGRIIILSLFIFSLIIYQFYSASLVSHLLIQPKSTIKTVRDILQSSMKVGCEDILYNKDYFIYTTDKSHKKMYEKLMRTPNISFLDPVEGIKLVDKGGYAFHVELATGYPIIQKTFSNRHICELNQVPLFGNKPMHTNLQKHSPFRDMFDTCVHRLAENGILHRETLFWHPKKPECNQAEKMFNVIGFDYFCPALFVLGCGMLLSLLILIGEMYVRYHDRLLWWQQKQNVIRPFVN